MQNNVVQLVPKDKKEEKNIEEFVNSIAEDTDQLLFIRIDKEGNLSLGHTPLSTKDLIVMYHQVNRYIQVLLESEGDMYVPKDP